MSDLVSPAAIEVLERAISKLETLRRGAREQGYLEIGEYQPWGEQNQNGDYAESILFDKRGETLAYGLPDGAGHLIVALSRTVEPMVSVLRGAIEEWRDYAEMADSSGLNPAHHQSVIVSGALALARAILGEEAGHA